MEQRMRNLEEFAQYATDMIVFMEEDRRHMEEARQQMEEGRQQMEEGQRRMEEGQMEECQLRMEERQLRRDELLQRLLQAVAVIQADIVRIDEAHS